MIFFHQVIFVQIEIHLDEKGSGNQQNNWNILHSIGKAIGTNIDKHLSCLFQQVDVTFGYKNNNVWVSSSINTLEATENQKQKFHYVSLLKYAFKFDR